MIIRSNRSIRLTAALGALIIAAAAQGFCGIINGNADGVWGQVNYTWNSPNMTDGNGLGRCYGVAIDTTAHRLFVTDPDNNRILWWNNINGTIENGQAASGVVGQADFYGHLPNRGGTPANNSLNSPYGVDVDGQGNLWVPDRVNNRVLRFPRAGFQSGNPVADLVVGQANFYSGDYNRTGSTTPSENTLRLPYNVHVDTSGNLWVADTYNCRVLRFKKEDLTPGNDPSADLVIGQPDFQTATSVCSDTKIFNPRGVTTALYGTTPVLLVADSYHRLLLFTDRYNLANGSAAAKVFGQNSMTAAVANRAAPNTPQANSINGPYSVNVDPANRYIWLADGANHRVLKYDMTLAEPALYSAIAALGQSSLAGSVASAGSANRGSVYCSTDTLSNPYGVDCDAAGNIWVADFNNCRVLKFPSNAATGDDATVVLGQTGFQDRMPNSLYGISVSTPYGVTIDAKFNRVFISDILNHRILWWDSVAKFKANLPANGALGQPTLSSGFINRGAAVSSMTFYDPRGVAIDRNGNVWVSDRQNNRILRFSDLASGGADRVIGQIDFTSNYVNQSAVVGALPTENTLARPYELAFDADGNLWAADGSNSRIVCFPWSSSTGEIAATATRVIGQASFTTSSPGTSAMALNSPLGISFDHSGNLWVGDFNNHRVLRFPAPIPPTGATADLVVGQQDFESSGANRGGRVNPVADGLKNPVSVAHDPSGNVWISDFGNSRIVCYPAPYTAASLVLGQEDFTSGGYNRANSAIAGQNTMNSPCGVFIDSMSVVWIGDSKNNRILRFSTPRALSATTPLIQGRSQSASVSGEEILPGTSVRLERNGETSRSATGLSFGGGTGITCTFDLIDAATGYWDLVMENQGYRFTGKNMLQVVTSTSSLESQVGSETERTLTLDNTQMGLVLTIGTGTFAGPTQIFAAFSSEDHAADQAGLLPTGIEFEFTNDSGLTARRDVTASLIYWNDALIAGRNEEDLALYYYDDTSGRWSPVATRVFPDENRIEARIRRPGTYRVFALSAPDDLSSFRVYPNPYRPNSGTRQDNSGLGKGIVFSGLTQQVRIKIFTIAGELVREITESKSSGVYLWDAKNDRGENVASGVYIYRIVNLENNTDLKKGSLAITR